MLAPESRSLDNSEKRTVLVCRDVGRRALLERLVPSAETHSSAIEAMLAVARKGPRAVVVNLRDVEGAERDVVAAVQRARPDVPVYFVVEPEDEPAGRRLRLRRRRTPNRASRMTRSRAALTARSSARSN